LITTATWPPAFTLRLVRPVLTAPMTLALAASAAAAAFLVALIVVRLSGRERPGRGSTS
jgi:hypothetical protein